MSVKERKEPCALTQLRSLLKRLPKNHPKFAALSNEETKRTIGFKGEKALDYYLEFNDKDRNHIYHNLKIAISHSLCQIDTLIINRSFILIIEIKNISGILFFDSTHHQLIRTLSVKPMDE
ncbi:NERD domain-containing protein [Sporolactobacillus shoreicorticis]|uniref:Nuclease-related domain-containing protein n=1 Tax=Sporolactobacillus shoreicorticis TaxID=1923877 RepID=A0ABW5S5N4_9BACL|nr:nuclease-related domain-containing protein [Sporolactobacillus shoreicorticis]MCO7126712.1 NERD domain-containing protein [Sporolactobacillus shoreicorticis]